MRLLLGFAFAADRWFVRNANSVIQLRVFVNDGAGGLALAERRRARRRTSTSHDLSIS